MGVGVFWDELFRKGTGYSDLVGINRAFFMQGLLLVSVCRRLPDPELPEQVKALKEVCNVVVVALRAGAKKDAEKPKVKEDTKAKFKDAETALSSYIDRNRVSLRAIRGSKPDQGYDGKYLSRQMADAMQSDGCASERLATINASLAAKIKLIKNKPTIKISIQYWPQVLPEWDPIAKMFPTFNPEDHISATYFGHELFKVEEGTYIEMLLHRLLQLTRYDKNIQKLSLEQKPELYASIPDDENPKPSLFPLSTVDGFKKKTLNITMEVKSKNIKINISTAHGKRLPADWTNIWVLDKGKSIMIRRNDENFSLYKYSLETFTQLISNTNANSLRGNSNDPPNTIPTTLPAYGPGSNRNAGLLTGITGAATEKLRQPNERDNVFQVPNGVIQDMLPPQQLHSSGNTVLQSTYPQPHYAGPQTAPPFTQKMPEPQPWMWQDTSGTTPQSVPEPMAHPQPIAAGAHLTNPNYNAHGSPPEYDARNVHPVERPITSPGLIPTTTGVGMSPAQGAQAAHSSRPSAHQTRNPDPPRGKATEAQKSKLHIPGSSSATHHLSGEMNTVGREKKAQPKGNIISRFFGWS